MKKIYNFDFIKGIITLGGLSECGKSHAGKYLESIGVKRQKIIEIEREMMSNRHFDLSNGMVDELFQKLYSLNIESVFEEFLSILLRDMLKDNSAYVSLESLYRPELGIFLKRKLGNKAINIYIESPLEVRILREHKRLIDLGECISIEDVRSILLKKDDFKIKHRANEIKHIADYIIDNSNDISVIEFEKQIYDVYKNLQKSVLTII